MLDKAKVGLNKQGEESDLTLLMSSTKRATRFGTREDMVTEINNKSINEAKESTITSRNTENERNYQNGNDCVLGSTGHDEKSGKVRATKNNQKTGKHTTSNSTSLKTDASSKSFEPIDISIIKPSRSRKPKDSIADRSTVKGSEYTESNTYTVKSESKNKRKRRRRRRKKPVNTSYESQPLSTLLTVHEDEETVSTKKETDANLRMGIRTTCDLPENEAEIENFAPPPRPKPAFDSAASVLQFLAQNSDRSLRKPRDLLPSAGSFVPPDIGRDSREDAFREPSAFKAEPIRELTFDKNVKFNKKPLAKAASFNKVQSKKHRKGKAVFDKVRKIVKKNL